ncbi:glycosyltransferase family 2 protein [Viscerimonas tarda]
MISICIPIYNGDVRKLVHELTVQATKLAVDYEVLLYDDKSDGHYKEINSGLSTLPNIRYKELSKNIGRSAIRNLLAKDARFRYLIFIDCDALVCTPDFLQKYQPYCHPGIVCYGGIKNYDECPAPEYYLNWRYGISREEESAEIRALTPNKNFHTFNFLIDKEIFEKNFFDENLKGYGHEDTLFGINLTEHNIEIVHINNPLLHTGLDSLDIFMQKTEHSIRNLVEIQARIGHKHDFTSEVRLLAAEQKIAFWKLSFPLSVFYKAGRKLMLKDLRGKKPHLFILDLYKLGYLCNLRRELQKK